MRSGSAAAQGLSLIHIWPAARLRVTQLYNGLGEAQFAVEFLPDEGLPPLPRMGITVRLPGSYELLRWLGRGPQEAYADRLDGCLLYTSRCV